MNTQQVINKKHVNSLISLYRENKISPKQFEELREIISSLSDEELHSIICIEWEQDTAIMDYDNLPDLSALSKRIHEHTKVIRKKDVIRLWSKVAAVAAIFILVFFYLHDRWNDSKTLERILTEYDRLPIQTEKIQLMLGTENVTEINKGSTITHHKDGTICIKSGHENRQIMKKDNIQYGCLYVPRGKYTHVILSDGTHIHVNAGTKIIYPTFFSGKQREIYVDGEVLLDVTRNEEMPFIVKADGFNVQVVGTIFNVNAYSDTPQSKKVILAQGSVNITTASGRSLMLLPDNEATVHSDGSITKDTIDAREYIFWTEGILSMKHDNLQDILVRLERYYGVEIEYSDELATVNITGKIDLECTVDEVLERISKVGGFSFTKEGNKYYLKAG